jgi:hypothetical protein
VEIGGRSAVLTASIIGAMSFVSMPLHKEFNLILPFIGYQRATYF